MQQEQNFICLYRYHPDINDFGLEYIFNEDRMVDAQAMLNADKAMNPSSPRSLGLIR